MTTLPWNYASGIMRTLEVPPTEEPLTVAEAKQRAGLEWSSEDPRQALMTDWIKAARQQVEHDTGLALLTQTWLVAYDTLYAGTIPQTMPTQSVVQLDAGQARIVSGWPSAAALKTAAPLLVQAVGLLAAHYATAGRDLASTEGLGTGVVPLGYEEAIAPYRQVWVI